MAYVHTNTMAVAACTIGARRSQFMKEYIQPRAEGAIVYPIGIFPDPRLWISREQYSQAQVVLAVSDRVDRAITCVFGENGHRRFILDILDIYRRDGKLSEVFLRLLMAYESLKHGRDGVERLMAREEVSRRLDLGDVLEMRRWKDAFTVK